MAEKADDATWHMSKAIPITFIMTFMLQIGAGLWWARGVEGDIENHKAAIAAINNIPERLARLEEGVKFIVEVLKTKKNAHLAPGSLPR